jgi:DNA-binding HxlR family transcriptional regulator
MVNENNAAKSEMDYTTECTDTLVAVSDALYAIGGKWKLVILIAISRGNTRFNTLQKTIGKISARVLSSELKELELNGFITKKVTAGYPVLIEYKLMPYSQTLEELIRAMKNWGNQHRAKIKADRS